MCLLTRQVYKMDVTAKNNDQIHKPNKKRQV